MVILFLCVLVKIFKFWKWILSKQKEKEKNSKNEDDMESQMEDKAKLENHVGANGGTILLDYHTTHASMICINLH
jgi:hypothetical protein